MASHLQTQPISCQKTTNPVIEFETKIYSHVIVMGLHKNWCVIEVYAVISKFSSGFTGARLCEAACVFFAFLGLCPRLRDERCARESAPRGLFACSLSESLDAKVSTNFKVLHGWSTDDSWDLKFHNSVIMKYISSILQKDWHRGGFVKSIALRRVSIELHVLNLQQMYLTSQMGPSL